MTWLRRHRVRHYVGDSIWILPVLGMIAAPEKPIAARAAIS